MVLRMLIGIRGCRVGAAAIADRANLCAKDTLLVIRGGSPVGESVCQTDTNCLDNGTSGLLSFGNTELMYSHAVATVATVATLTSGTTGPLPLAALYRQLEVVCQVTDRLR